ncbi:hypothetical protein [Geomesophilobacter sediminis]|uniref:Uncharacterized protein n=1 Tax=Geomesophilobacter sediminis TaxID=2798584 RepID=A0A8J7JL59_9BACT|nr:hypothetical protein [Geomesophilobacter sediminis]MBJ6724520.1 hypothetical protein [Geomesophilobacter sediminis]
MRYKIKYSMTMIVLLLSFAGVTLLCSGANGGKSMQNNLYHLKEAKSLHHIEYNLNAGLFRLAAVENISIFAVPQPNSVGSNDINNSITIFTFGKTSMHRHTYFKNAVEDIGGGGQYLPVISPDLIGFGQTRAFEIYDFKMNLHREFTIVSSLGGTIEKIAIADAQRRHFIFDIERHSGRSHDPWDTSSTLHLIDLGGENIKVIKKLDIGSATTWTLADNKLFLYDIGKDIFKVVNLEFETVNHPLLEIVKKNKLVINFTRVHLHPYLPFAIFEAGEKDEVVVTWDQKRSSTPQSLFGQHVTSTEFDFSPDGNWVVFQVGGAMDDKKTYLMPVSERYPFYLGTPMKLGDVWFNAGRFAWTTNPVSFVGCFLEDIYRWDLSKEAHPECKRATFHDCVVEEDLQKLAKERRQGLGAKGR